MTVAARQGEITRVYNLPYRAHQMMEYPIRKGADFLSRWFTNKSCKERLVKVMNGAKLHDWQRIDCKTVNPDVQHLRQRIFVAKMRRTA